MLGDDDDNREQTGSSNFAPLMNLQDTQYVNDQMRMQSISFAQTNFALENMIDDFQNQMNSREKSRRFTQRFGKIPKSKTEMPEVPQSKPSLYFRRSVAQVDFDENYKPVFKEEEKTFNSD